MNYTSIQQAVKAGLENSSGNCLDCARERGVVLRRIMKEVRGQAAVDKKYKRRS